MPMTRIPRIPYTITRAAAAAPFARVPFDTERASLEDQSRQDKPRVPARYTRSPAPSRNGATRTAMIAPMNARRDTSTDLAAASTLVRLTEKTTTRPTIMRTLWTSQEPAPAAINAPPNSRRSRQRARSASGPWAALPLTSISPLPGEAIGPSEHNDFRRSGQRGHRILRNLHYGS